MPALIRCAIRTAAGDAEATAEAVARGKRCFRPAPYPTEGLGNPLAASIDGLERERPAETLLLDLLEELLDGHPTERMGLLVATSSGNVCGVFEANHRAELEGADRSLPRPGRDGPTLAAEARFGFGGPVSTLSLACVSGTAAFTVAWGWLADGRCDTVAVVGLDALSLFVHAGFSGLGALTASFPRPFTDDRDGMLLGEAAAGVLLGHDGSVHIAGVGMRADARSITAPDPEGRAALVAARNALSMAGVDARAIRLVSPHGTGTVYNDAMEMEVLRQLFRSRPPLQLVKSAVGHTLGAAGTLEAILAARALGGKPGAALSLSSAFGGLNAAVVLRDRPGAPLPQREVATGPTRRDVRDLDALWPEAPALVRSRDRYARTGLAAVLEAHAEEPLTPDTALVIASRSNCAIADRAHHRRIVEDGPRWSSRRAFSATLPARPLVEASIALGLHGPVLAFVDGPHRAVEEAEALVRHGFADDALALALEVPEDGSAQCSSTRIRAR